MQARKHYTVEVTPGKKVYVAPRLLSGASKRPTGEALNAVSTLLVASTSQSCYITDIQPSNTLKERGLLVNFIALSSLIPHIEKRFFPYHELLSKQGAVVTVTEEPLPPAVHSQVREAEKRIDSQAKLEVMNLRERQEQERASLQAARQAEKKQRQTHASVKEEPAKEKILSEVDKRKLDADRKAEEDERTQELLNELKETTRKAKARKEKARVEQLQYAQEQRAQEQKHHAQERKNIQKETVEAGKLFATDFTTDPFSQAYQASNAALQITSKEIDEIVAAHKKAKDELFTATDYDPQELSHRLEQKEIKAELIKLEHAIDETKQEIATSLSARDKALFALEKQTSIELQQASAKKPTVLNVLHGAVQAAIDEYCQTVLMDEQKKTEFLTLFKKSYPSNKQYKEGGLGITLFSEDSSGHIQVDPTLENVPKLQWQKKINGVFSRIKEGFSQHELLKGFPAVLSNHLQKNLGSQVIDSSFLSLSADKLVLEKAVIQKNAVKILPKQAIVAQRAQATQQVIALSQSSSLDTDLLKEQLSNYMRILQREQSNLREIVNYRKEVTEKKKEMVALLEETTAMQNRVHLMMGAKSEPLPEARTIAEALASIRKNNEEIMRTAATLNSVDISVYTAEKEVENVERLLQAAKEQIQTARSAARAISEKQLDQAQAELYALVKTVLVEQTPFLDQPSMVNGQKVTPATVHSKKRIMPTGVEKMIKDIEKIEQHETHIHNKTQTALMALAKIATARTNFKNSLFSPTRTPVTNQLYSIIKECTAKNLQDVTKVKLLTQGLKVLQDYQKTQQPHAKNDKEGRLKRRT